MDNKTIHIQFSRQPKYYKNFSCIGGSCPMSCCLVWRVDWKSADIEKLRSADCSPELKELAEKSFSAEPVSDDTYPIIMVDKVRCPFLTEDNFCRIQRELGEEYLSYVCRKYPRQGRVCGNYAYNYCNLSCYAVMDTLCSDSGCMELENKPVRGERELAYSTDKELNVMNNPELKYHGMITEFFYNMISDSSYSLETSVILGAAAANILSKFIARCSNPDKIPQQIEILKKQLDAPEQIKRLEIMKPNYQLKLSFSASLFNHIVKSDLLESLGEKGTINIGRYRDGENKFKAAFEDRPFAMRNIALNFLLELNVPFRNIKYSIFDNYTYFVSALAVTKLIAAAAFEKGGDSEKTFKTVTSYTSRFYAHNITYFDKIADLAKKAGIVSPGHISALIK